MDRLVRAHHLSIPQRFAEASIFCAAQIPDLTGFFCQMRAGGLAGPLVPRSGPLFLLSRPLGCRKMAGWLKFQEWSRHDAEANR